MPAGAWGLSAVLWCVWMFLVGFVFAFTPALMAYGFAVLGF